MEIFQLTKLSVQQKKDVENLVIKCNQFEDLNRSLLLDNEDNFYEDLKCFYLLYINKVLISTLVIDQLLMEQVEISAYTLPEFRRQGYFCRLLLLAKEELSKFGIERMLFLTEANSLGGKNTCLVCADNYLKSEYLLEYDLSWELIEDNLQRLCMKEMKREDKDKAVVLSCEIFDTDTLESSYLIEMAISSDNMECIGAYYDNILIGICNVFYGENTSSIFGFGMKKKEQGKGLGFGFLMKIMTYVKNNGYNRMTLQVGSENKRAFEFYRKVGFEINTQYDYYEKRLNV